MEANLKNGRERLQRMLLGDCVAAGLVDAPKAQEQVGNMTGKNCEDAERAIVEHLREVLQGLVRSFIHKSKGGPWSTPLAPADLQQDIHRASSVRSGLMLCRQAWEEAHGRHRLRGLLAARS
jgi:hypothetical protein